MAAKVTRRVLLKWAALGATGLAVGACTPPTPTPTQVPAAATKPAVATPAAKAPEKAEVVWARHGDEVRLREEEALGSLFTERSPNITVKAMTLPFADFTTKIPVMIAGGTAPDVFAAYPVLLMESYNVGGVRPIEDYVQAAEPGLNYKDYLFPGDALWDSHIVGLPSTSTPHIVRFNKDLFAKEGLPTPAELYWQGKEKEWNWNSFVELGQKLTKDLTGDKQIDQYFYSGVGHLNYLALVRMAGGEILSKEGAKCVANEPAAKEALQFVSDLVLKYKIVPPPELDAAGLGMTFMTGKIAVESTPVVAKMAQLKPGSELPFKWDFAPNPAGKIGFRAHGDTDQMVIYKGCKNPEAAFEWMKYRSSIEIWEDSYAKGIKMAYSSGPTRWSVFQSKPYTEVISTAGLDTKMLPELWQHAVPQPSLARVKQANRVYNTIITTELGNVARGAKSVDQAAADMCAQIEQVLKEG